MELRISRRSRLKVNNLYFMMIMRIGHNLDEEEVDRRRGRITILKSFASLATRAANAAKTGQDGKGLLQSHL